jgi:hemoglobin-like flavoprotein
LEQRHLLRKSFQAVEAAPLVAALIFYRRLFELEPRLRPLFKTDIEIQSAKLVDMLRLSLSLLERPAALAAELEELGARHVTYGVKEEHYELVGQALLEMLQQVQRNGFDAQTRAAWVQLCGLIQTTMLRGAARMTGTVTTSREPGAESRKVLREA